MPRTPSHTRRSPSFHRALVVCAVAIAAVTTTVATVAVERQGARERERAVVDAAAHALEREMAVRAAALRGAQGLIAASDRVEAAEFRRFGRLALGSGSDATWHPVVREPGRVAFERAVAPIAALDAAGNRRAAAVRDLYLPAALGATSGGASWHLGVDLLSDPWRAAAADRAIASGTLAVSPAVALPTPSRPQGLVLVLPVYGTAPDVPPPAERRARLSGVVVDSVPLALLERRVRSGLPDEVSLVIEAGSREVADGPDASTRTGGQWMHIHVTSRFRAQVRLPLAVGVAGFAIVLLTALLMRQAGRRDQEVRAALAHQSEARTAAESALRLREDRFRVLAQEVPVGICILTPEGIVEFANQRCAELLGVSIAGLVGESLVRPAVAGADRERFADALRVAVRDGERLSTAVGIRHPNGDEARLRVQAVPAGTGADRRHLCTVTDITDEHLRELRERALAQVAAVVASDPGMEAVMEAASAARDAVPGRPAGRAHDDGPLRRGGQGRPHGAGRARPPDGPRQPAGVLGRPARGGGAGGPGALLRARAARPGPLQARERHPWAYRGGRRAAGDRRPPAPVGARLGPGVPRGR